jgi:hypothetical protein
MKHAQFPSISQASPSSLSYERKPSSGRSFFARLLDALHASRRLESARAIRQYRHLTHETRGPDAEKKT